MTEEVIQLCKELQSGFEADPSEAKRELERMDYLCNRAAERIAIMDEVNNKLESECEYLRDDPFKVLNRINVNEHVEKKAVKNNKTGEVKYLSYLSWAWAWQMLMTLYPESYTEINRPETGYPYWTDGKTCWVDVSVAIVWKDGSYTRTRRRSEIFPVMGWSNTSIPVDKVTSFDVNTALQRAWTKCIARHGLGFYIYAGEDLPEEEAEAKKAEACTDEQLEKVFSLYNEKEIARMLKRLKKSNPAELTKEEAQTMIDKRDLSLVSEQVESF